MSERVRPVDLPEAIDWAIEVLGNRVKVAALLALHRYGPATTTEIAERLQISREAARHHLVGLERLGLVSVQPPRSEPEVRRRYFHVDPVALRAAVGAFGVLLATEAS